VVAASGGRGCRLMVQAGVGRWWGPHGDDSGVVPCPEMPDNEEPSVTKEGDDSRWFRWLLMVVKLDSSRNASGVAA
jgi:hypothetical protein